LKKNISEQNDGISSEILPSFRTEAVEDSTVSDDRTKKDSAFLSSAAFL
jgi:hypothetical protein